MITELAYLLPLLPMATRLVLFLQFRESMRQGIKKSEQDRDAHRGHIMAMTGFAFSVLTGAIFLEATLRLNLQITIYYLSVSLVSFYTSYNIQSYKSWRWQDQLATMFADVGTLSLLLSLMSIFFIQDINLILSWAFSLVLFFSWSVDHCLRLKYQAQYLREKEKLNGKEG